MCVYVCTYSWTSLVAQTVKNLPAVRRPEFDLWVGKIPWRKAWLPTPGLLTRESHGQRSLAVYSPWDHKVSDTTEWHSLHFIYIHTHSSLGLEGEAYRLQFTEWMYVSRALWWGDQHEQNQFSSVHSLSRVRLFSTPWITARQASLFITNPEFTQTHAHWVRDAIQPTHPLSSPSPPAPNPSQHQGLFQWANSLHEVAKVLEFQLQHQSFQWTSRTDLLLDRLVGSPCSPRDSQESSPTP